MIGDAAGFLNIPKIEGTHTAMKSGMLAAEAVAEALAGNGEAEVAAPRPVANWSWVWDELTECARHPPRPSEWVMWGGLAYSGLDTYVLRGKAPWTLHHPHADNETLAEADKAPRITSRNPMGC